MTKPEKKAATDWVVIEVDYRAGIKPLRQIASENGITHGAITKRANRDGWARDLASKIKARAEEKVSKRAVSSEVSAKRVATETQVVEANAELQFKVRMEHRTDIQRGRQLYRNLMSELEATTDNAELFAQLGELLDTSSPDASGNWKVDKQNELYKKVISHGGRVGTHKQLVETLEKLVKMERQAFGIDDTAAQTSPLDEMLKRFSAQRDAA
jgi:hypothetical protein